MPTSRQTLSLGGNRGREFMQIKSASVNTSVVKTRGNSEVYSNRKSGGQGVVVQAKH